MPQLKLAIYKKLLLHNFSCIIDAEGLVTQAKYQKGFFSACIFILFQHGNPIEKVSGLNH